MIKRYFNRGISLVEVVLATAIFLALVLGILGTYSYFIRTAFSNTATLQANLLLEEGAETLRFLRDASWTDNITPLTVGNTYSFSKTGLNWSIVSSPEYIGGFLRTFSVFPVYRDENDDIAETGSIDSNIVKLVISVAWSERSATTTREMTMYLSNIFE